MSADSEKPNILRGNWTKYGTVAKSVGRGRPIWTSVVVRARARASLALCGRFNQCRSPYSWITMRRALRKRRVFDFVPSYLKLFQPYLMSRPNCVLTQAATAKAASPFSSETVGLTVLGISFATTPLENILARDGLEDRKALGCSRCQLLPTPPPCPADGDACPSPVYDVGLWFKAVSRDAAPNVVSRFDGCLRRFKAAPVLAPLAPGIDGPDIERRRPAIGGEVLCLLYRKPTPAVCWLVSEPLAAALRFSRTPDSATPLPRRVWETKRLYVWV